ncbi:DUF669 domain-containing protein [Gammaproteobacteria bacterium]
MALDFTPQTEEELAEAGLLAKGEYPFEILFAEDKRSKKGNAMIEIKLCVFTNDGKTRKLTDYLLSAMAYKLRHFCDAVGLLPQYQNGSLCAADCGGRTGTCKVDIVPAKDGYPPKNEVKDYLTRPAKPLEAKPEVNAAAEEDNLPF